MPIVVVTSKNIDQILPTIKETVFANEVQVIRRCMAGARRSGRRPCASCLSER